MVFVVHQLNGRTCVDSTNKLTKYIQLLCLAVRIFDDILHGSISVDLRKIFLLFSSVVKNSDALMVFNTNTIEIGTHYTARIVLTNLHFCFVECQRDTWHFICKYKTYRTHRFPYQDLEGSKRTTRNSTERKKAVTSKSSSEDWLLHEYKKHNSSSLRDPVHCLLGFRITHNILWPLCRPCIPYTMGHRNIMRLTNGRCRVRVWRSVPSEAEGLYPRPPRAPCWSCIRRGVVARAVVRVVTEVENYLVPLTPILLDSYHL